MVVPVVKFQARGYKNQIDFLKVEKLTGPFGNLATNCESVQFP